METELSGCQRLGSRRGGLNGWSIRNFEGTGTIPYFTVMMDIRYTLVKSYRIYN